MDVTDYQSKHKISCYHNISYGYAMRTMHAHNDYEIHYSKLGGQTFFVNDSVYPVEKNDVFVFSPTDMHKVNVPADMHYERYIIYFKAEIAQSLSEFTDSKNGDKGDSLLECFENRPTGVGPRISLDEKESAELDGLADELSRIFESPSEYGRNIEMKLTLGRILLLVNRLFREKHDLQPPNEQVKVYSHSMSMVTAYIDQHFTESISLNDISGHCHLDKAYLCRLFKRVTGLCITDYINYKRISYATAQLRGGASVSEAAQAAGFNSDAYFITRFKRAMHCTPGQYLKSLNHGI